MSRVRDVVETGRESVEKAAFVAIGAPVAAVKAVSARVSEIRDAVRSSSRELGDDLSKEMEQWIAEGERVLEKAMKRIRESETVDNARSGMESVRSAAKNGADTAAAGVEKAMDVVSPEESLTVINGIGSSYAEQLSEAGLNGVTDLLAKTATSEETAALADRTGFSAATIESWRKQVDLSRVDGVGGAYQQLLHRVDIWTLGQLAAADADQLTQEMSEVNLPDSPEQKPSVYTVKQWISEAKKLARTG